MSTIARYYVPSGRVAPSAPLSVALLGGLGALLCASLYAVVIRYNPFVYFSVIATVVFGLAIGVVASSAAQHGKSRSTLFNVASALALAMFALWVHWLIWTALRLEDGSRQAMTLATSGPSGWAGYLSWLADNYHLSIGRRARHGAEMSATQMHWVWLVEAVLVIVAALLSGWASSTGRAFSEVTGKWASVELDVHTSDAGLSVAELKAALERGDFALLDEVTVVDPESENSPTEWKTLSVKLAAEPGDPQLRLISVDAVVNRRDDKGNLKQDSTTVVQNLLLPELVYDALLSRLRAAPLAAAVPNGTAAVIESEGELA